MHSMTGFGRGRCSVDGRRVVVEIRAVNHRFLDVKQRLPWPEPGVEQRIVHALRERLQRGALNVTVRDEGGGDLGPKILVDAGLAAAYHRALCDIAAACGMDERPGLATLAALPGVLTVGDPVRDEEGLWRFAPRNIQRRALCAPFVLMTLKMEKRFEYYLNVDMDFIWNALNLG